MTTPTIESFAANMVKVLREIAVLAEYGTTGPGKCDSYALTAQQATALRRAISDLARAGLELAEVAPQAIAAGKACSAASMIEPLARISLASQNSMSSKEECGRIARDAIAKIRGSAS